ncbi:MAG: TniQ family protein [Beijerinckiaceae bacterium]
MSWRLLPDLLPVAPRPAPDERLASWLSRMGALYAMTADEFLVACGVTGIKSRDLEWRIGCDEARKLAAPAGLAAAAIRAMTFDGFMADARAMIAVGARRTCPICAREGIERRINAWPWTFRCPAHKHWLADPGGQTLAHWSEPATLEQMALAAGEGALRLKAWAEGCEREEPSASELLCFLIASHRRPSPPSLSEQPRLSLQARRENSALLSRPIRRQAVLVVVPEYDRVAPVLTKAMPVGPDVLAKTSLLQSFALVVGVGRLGLDPARQVGRVLSESDGEGAMRLEGLLRTWPKPVRHAILAALKRIRREKPGSDRPAMRLSASGNQASLSNCAPTNATRHLGSLTIALQGAAQAAESHELRDSDSGFGVAIGIWP